jgi:hypothetical protein
MQRQNAAQNRMCKWVISFENDAANDRIDHKLFSLSLAAFNLQNLLQTS